ncbi:hypothetical protein Asp14428_01330 [Actinoplanes sp. NBRC 14428]|uniref:BON domain-containing protein n=1 Tax=Pseudosporangium ferrugineum TaxID=439699 RepID=A0A2T0SIV2_9ACTN|nr:BON domain-containing protein [Pseudosporangium ferrugineum]PRY33342.1 BON domain-containing protein [Pseudosporangium ferrugineum]BCJ48658.1 hypothetical protein Asp14428_01330 [Actinoplanes sp. NBRC 14428]
MSFDDDWISREEPYGLDGEEDTFFRPGPEATLLREAALGLARDPQVRCRELVIEVQNNVVIIEGYAESPAAKEAAGRRVWSTPGVRDVCNRLIVR